MKPIEIPQATYRKIAEHIIDTSEYEMGNEYFESHYFNLIDIDFEIDKNDPLIAIINGSGYIHYHVSREAWGIDRVIDSIGFTWIECVTKDSDGNDVINDFSAKTLEEYLS